MYQAFNSTSTVICPLHEIFINIHFLLWLLLREYSFPSFLTLFSFLFISLFISFSRNDRYSLVDVKEAKKVHRKRGDYRSKLKWNIQENRS